MYPLLVVPALIQAAPGLPPAFAVPEGLQIKPGTLQVSSYDEETFEVQAAAGQGPMRVTVKGRSWRFALESAGVRAGIFSLLQKFKPALMAGGWTWQWEQRNVARRTDKTSDWWIKAGPSGGAALQVVLMQPGEPRKLTLLPPGPVPEYPKPEEDFPYVTPWPGAQIVGWAASQAPVAADLGDGKQGFVGVNWIEKGYALPDPPSPYEFVVAYREALKAAGWDIDGDSHGNVVQVQASYFRNGRDIRLLLRLADNTMAISVADVGAQLKK